MIKLLILILPLNLLGVDIPAFEEQFNGIINTYRHRLPMIQNYQGADPARRIMNYLMAFSNQTGNLPSKIALRDKIRGQMHTGEPLNFLLPAFPFKSKNPAKVLGDDPDLGDLIALETLSHMARQIKDVYGPGARINLIADGVLCAEALGVSENEVTAYVLKIRQLISLNNMPLTIQQLDNLDHVKTYGKKFDQLTKILDAVPVAESDHLASFVSREMQGAYYVVKYGDGLNEQVENAKTLISTRSLKFSALLQEITAGQEFIRLSIHKNNRDISVKKHIQLIINQPRGGTPWHNAPFVDANLNITLGEVVPGITFAYQPYGIDFPIRWIVRGNENHPQP